MTKTIQDLEASLPAAGEWRQLQAWRGAHVPSTPFYVSSEGWVASIGEGKITRLHGQPIQHGYVQVNLRWAPYGRWQQLIHRLVARTFLGFAGAKGLTIDHLNGEVADNSLSNLEVVPHSVNLRRRRHFVWRAKLPESVIYAVVLGLLDGRSQQDVAASNGVSLGSVRKILREFNQSPFTA